MHTCHLCANSTLIPLLELGSHPIAQHLLYNQNDEVYTHPVRVQLCPECGLIQLVDEVPPEKFYTNYVTLSSWKAHPHVSQVIELLRSHAQLQPSVRIVEVGSNDGSFLDELRRQGCGNAVGIEPAQDARRAAAARGIETFGEYLTPETAESFVSRYGRADLIVSRHVVEHITHLRPFSDSLRKLCKPGAYVLIEIPHFDFCLDVLDYSGIWEQHSNYFTRSTLNHFLQRTGIELCHHQTFAFSGTAQVAIGRFTGRSSADPLAPQVRQNICARAFAYRNLFPDFKSALHRELAALRRTHGPLALYGAGSRTCSLVNYLQIGSFFDFVADDQSEKQNRFLPGSRLPILPGTALDESTVGLCVLGVNAEVESKVIARRARFTSRGGQFRSVHPPSPLLLDAWEHVRASRTGRDAA
jgi:2-polyprenyl-3-methyl-5-hydroxy-6-metoxy-1,4-benzoquinol methylase